MYLASIQSTLTPFANVSLSLDKYNENLLTFFGHSTNINQPTWSSSRRCFKIIYVQNPAWRKLFVCFPLMGTHFLFYSILAVYSSSLLHLWNYWFLFVGDVVASNNLIVIFDGICLESVYRGFIWSFCALALCWESYGMVWTLKTFGLSSVRFINRLLQKEEFRWSL